jgi:uncharacterized protein
VPEGNGRQRAADEELIAGIWQTLAVIEADLPSYNLLPTLIDRANFGVPHAKTCGVGDNYLVIDHRGRLARCHMDIAHTIGSIWEKDPLLTVRQTPINHNFTNISVENKEECSTCPWRYWCSGGCPLLAYHSGGSVTAKSPYCNVYKAVFPELLRLEGLRLLKWQAADAS